MAYLESSERSDAPTIETTKKALREALSIPERSLDKVLKSLKAKGKVLFTVKAGRGGGIRLASIKAVFLNLIQLKKETQEARMNVLSAMFEESKGKLQSLLKTAVNGVKVLENTHLFEEDIG